MTAAAELDAPALGLPPIEEAPPQPDDRRLWSVTTIIGVLDKSALKWWAAEEAAKAAVAIAGSLEQRIREDGEAEVIDWLRRAMNRKPVGLLGAAALGSCAHEACQQYALTGVRPTRADLEAIVRREGGPKFSGVVAEAAVVARMLDQFDRWLQRFTPSYDAAEVVVYHPEFGYAGSADAFLRIDGVRLITDYKSSRTGYDRRGRPKGPYPEAALQLSAYRHATHAAVWRARRTEQFRRRYYLLSDAERDKAVPVPEVDGGIVIHLTPDHCESFPVRCDARVFERFLFVQEAARWHLEMAKDVVGMPMVAGGAA